MTKKTSPALEGPVYQHTIHVTFCEAERFLTHTDPLIKQLAEVKSRGPSVENLRYVGDVAVAATNLHFALELYLKALHMVTARQPPGTHHLAELYSGLPARQRHVIEAEYERRAVRPPRANIEIEVTQRLRRDGKARATTPDSTDKSIKAVLARSARGFEGWRYLFEQTHRAAYDQAEQYSAFEFYRLRVIADILREQAVQHPVLQHPPLQALRPPPSGLAPPAESK